jgi:hypothetical protein
VNSVFAGEADLDGEVDRRWSLLRLPSRCRLCGLGMCRWRFVRRSLHAPCLTGDGFRPGIVSVGVEARVMYSLPSPGL